MRTLASIVCTVLGALCVVLAPPALWTHYVVLDTDRYVKTLEPLAHNRGVQEVVANSVEAGIMDKLNLGDPVLQSAAAQLVGQVALQVTRSSAFPPLWNAVVRETHPEVVYMLTGRSSRNSNVAVNDNGDVVLDVSPVVVQVRSDLLIAGLAAVGALPPVQATIDLVGMKGFRHTQPEVRALDKMANALVFGAIVLLAAGFFLAPSWKGAAGGAAAFIVGGMFVELLALAVTQGSFAKSVPTTDVPHALARYVFDTSTRDLRFGILATLGATVVSVFLAFWVSNRRPEPKKS